MTIKTLAAKGVAKRAIARQLTLSEGTVRYHLRRLAAGARDGRALQKRRAAVHREAIDHWMSTHEQACNLAALHAWLTREHGFAGSLRAVQRYVAQAYPPPPRRARRRVETPAGAQAQLDWAEYPRVIVAGAEQKLHSFHMTLSHSRFDAIVWMERQDTLSWLAAHNGAFTRVGGIAAVMRIDNLRTAVARGAGAWGELTDSYRRYALTVRFHVDVCAPYSPEHKGKVERQVRTQRARLDPSRRCWDSLEELQAWSDAESLRLAHERRCPATGTSVWEAWQQERSKLAPLPILPEPFDHVATRRVAADALVSFEGRQYSVPFAYLGREVEVRGGARHVQILADHAIIAQHPRRTPERLLIDPKHYDGTATPTVLPPTPLGRLGRRLQELASLPVERRPLDLYAALAEVAR